MSIPLNIDYQQILLHLFNFSILAGGLYLLLYRPVKQFMERREAYYEDIHRQAQEDRDQAEQLKAACQEKLAQADAVIGPSAGRRQSGSWITSDPSDGGCPERGGGHFDQSPGRGPAGAGGAVVQSHPGADGCGGSRRGKNCPGSAAGSLRTVPGSCGKGGRP